MHSLSSARRASAPGALAFALWAAAPIACSDGGGGEAGQETEAPGERECFVCESQRLCMAQSCTQAVSECWGPNYFDGANGGACADVLDCLETCACDDDACEMGCFADAAVECLSCTTQVKQCEQSMCAAEDACSGTT